MYDVAVVKYKEGLESLRNAVELIGGLQGFSGDSKVVIKPNLLLWFERSDFPKYGVMTTAKQRGGLFEPRRRCAGSADKTKGKVGLKKFT